MKRLAWMLLVVACGCEDKDEARAPTLSCDELGRAYEAALALAKQCSPASGCNVEVEDRLGCACPTFVSSANQSRVESLRSLKQKWTAAMCAHSVGCVPTRCETVTRGECSNAGRCLDVAR